MKRTENHKNSILLRMLELAAAAAVLVLVLTGCTADDIIKTVEGTIVVSGEEYGPGVTRVILRLNALVDAVDDTVQAVVQANGNPCNVTSAYLSDEQGNAASGASDCVTVNLDTSAMVSDGLLTMQNDQEHLEWSDEYIVSTMVAVVKDGESVEVSYTDNASQNFSSDELTRWNVSGSYTGDYENPMTGVSEELSLNWAAYEPAALADGAQNPLIIWLHGRWEGGTDITETILGNEVTALTEDDIQSYFTSGDQTGAYVLLVQTPTYWMDAGDGTESEGDRCSRYTEILMDTIRDYLAQNPDVDTSRIYLGGGSNGGYMTVEMLIHYPDFFAAGFPVSAAYAYYNYRTNGYGEYLTDWSGNMIKSGCNITDADLAALAQTPTWFVACSGDTVVPASDFTLPLYTALLRAGADNCYLSLYDAVRGDDSMDFELNDHWAWIYVFNDEVSAVQNNDTVLSSRGFGGFGWDSRNSSGGNYSASSAGGSVAEYDSLFAWLSEQSL